MSEKTTVENVSVNLKADPQATDGWKRFATTLDDAWDSMKNLLALYPKLGEVGEVIWKSAGRSAENYSDTLGKVFSKLSKATTDTSALNVATQSLGAGMDVLNFLWDETANKMERWAGLANTTVGAAAIGLYASYKALAAAIELVGGTFERVGKHVGDYVHIQNVANEAIAQSTNDLERLSYRAAQMAETQVFAATASQIGDLGVAYQNFKVFVDLAYTGIQSWVAGLIGSAKAIPGVQSALNFLNESFDSFNRSMLERLKSPAFKEAFKVELGDPRDVEEHFRKHLATYSKMSRISEAALASAKTQMDRTLGDIRISSQVLTATMGIIAEREGMAARETLDIMSTIIQRGRASTEQWRMLGAEIDTTADGLDTLEGQLKYLFEQQGMSLKDFNKLWEDISKNTAIQGRIIQDQQERVAAYNRRVTKEMVDGAVALATSVIDNEDLKRAAYQQSVAVISQYVAHLGILYERMDAVVGLQEATTGATLFDKMDVQMRQLSVSMEKLRQTKKLFDEGGAGGMDVAKDQAEVYRGIAATITLAKDNAILFSEQWEKSVDGAQKLVQTLGPVFDKATYQAAGEVQLAYNEKIASQLQTRFKLLAEILRQQEVGSQSFFELQERAVRAAQEAVTFHTNKADILSNTYTEMQQLILETQEIESMGIKATLADRLRAFDEQARRNRVLQDQYRNDAVMMKKLQQEELDIINKKRSAAQETLGRGTGGALMLDPMKRAEEKAAETWLPQILKRLEAGEEMSPFEMEMLNRMGASAKSFADVAEKMGMAEPLEAVAEKIREAIQGGQGFDQILKDIQGDDKLFRVAGDELKRMYEEISRQEVVKKEDTKDPFEGLKKTLEGMEKTASSLIPRINQQETLLKSFMASNAVMLEGIGKLPGDHAEKLGGILKKHVDDFKAALAIGIQYKDDPEKAAEKLLKLLPSEGALEPPSSTPSEKHLEGASKELGKQAQLMGEAFKKRYAAGMSEGMTHEDSLNVAQTVFSEYLRNIDRALAEKMNLSTEEMKNVLGHLDVRAEMIKGLAPALKRSTDEIMKDAVELGRLGGSRTETQQGEMHRVLQESFPKILAQASQRGWLSEGGKSEKADPLIGIKETLSEWLQKFTDAISKIPAAQVNVAPTPPAPVQVNIPSNDGAVRAATIYLKGHRESGASLKSETAEELLARLRTSGSIKFSNG